MSIRPLAIRLAASRPPGDPLRLAVLRLVAKDVTWAQVKKILDGAGLVEMEDEVGDYEKMDYDYSGRGMNGRKSSIAVEIVDIRKHGPTSAVGKKLKSLGLAHDSLGKNVVYYTT